MRAEEAVLMADFYAAYLVLCGAALVCFQEEIKMLKRLFQDAVVKLAWKAAQWGIRQTFGTEKGKEIISGLEDGTIGGK